MLVGSVVALLRVGSAGIRGVVWAEDGEVFLSEAYVKGGWNAIDSAYAGYIHVAPRTLIAILTVLPISWQGVAVAVAAVAVQAGVAAFVFHVVRANAAGIGAPALTAAAVVLVPVGGETAANVANLQWFLLFGAVIAPLWQPAGRSGKVASAAMILAATTSSPFGPLRSLLQPASGR